jgi:integrase
MARRPRGTGNLYARRDKSGRETWYGRYYVGGRLRKKRLGLKRTPSTRDGLTEVQAARELRRFMDEDRWTPPEHRIGLEEAGRRYLRRLELLGRKATTRAGYDSYLRIQLVPFFGDKALDAVTPSDVQAFMSKALRDGRSPKSVHNFVTFLHAIFAFGEREGWTTHNPVRLVEKPSMTATDPDIRFLTREELERLVAKVPAGEFGNTDRVLYLAAAMTGARQGELRALRWRDIDWSAMRVRIRRNYVLGEYGTPKSKRSSRSVPLGERLGGALERHFQRSEWQEDDDLVFPNPATGEPLDPSALLRRYKAALEAAKVRKVRFHDLRHTFGTLMAAAGVPIRTLQEWMGHANIQTTMIYADYAPSEHEAEWVRLAFTVPTTVGTRGHNGGHNLNEPQRTSANHEGALESQTDSQQRSVNR